MRDTVAKYEDLTADLHAAVDGEVRFDEYAQILYATDGSIYQARPAGAVEPRHTEDVRAVMRVAADHDVPVIARGTGSSLGSQAVGPGCVVLDLSTHMDELVEIRPNEQRAVVQSGIVRTNSTPRSPSTV